MDGHIAGTYPVYTAPLQRDGDTEVSLDFSGAASSWCFENGIQMGASCDVTIIPDDPFSGALKITTEKDIGFVVGGTQRANISDQHVFTLGNSGSLSDPKLKFSGSTNTGIFTFDESADILSWDAEFRLSTSGEKLQFVDANKFIQYDGTDFIISNNSGDVLINATDAVAGDIILTPGSAALKVSAVTDNFIFGSGGAFTIPGFSATGGGSVGAFSWFGSTFGAFFNFSDHMRMATSKEYQCRDANQFVRSPAANTIEVGANTTTDLSIGGTVQLSLTDGVFAPETDLDVDLGTSSKKFKRLYHHAYASQTLTTATSASAAEYNAFNAVGTANVTADGISLASGVFTCNEAGIHWVQATLIMTASATADVDVIIKVNSSPVYDHPVKVHSSVDAVERTIGIMQDLSASDTVSFHVDSTTAATVVVEPGSTANLMRFS